MERFYMRLADKVIAVSANYAETKEFCKDYLVEEPEQVDIDIRITQEEAIERERLAYENGEPLFWENYSENLVLYRKIAEKLLPYHTVWFHGSSVAVDGEVYVFTAPSGTGKSTHTRLWRRLLGDKAMVVNDDKPLMHLNEDGSITVYGNPWNGKHNLGNNVALPLKAVCAISQAKENKIERVSTKEGFMTLMVQTYLRELPKDLKTEEMKIILEVLAAMMEKPMWHLECNISKAAAVLSYETLTGNKVEE